MPTGRPFYYDFTNYSRTAITMKESPHSRLAGKLASTVSPPSASSLAALLVVGLLIE